MIRPSQTDRTRRFLPAAALALSVALAWSPVGAGMIVHWDTFHVGSSATTATIEFPTFDSSLGTLTSVQLDRQVIVSGDAVWHFIASPGPVTEPAPVSADLDVSVAGTFGLGSAFSLFASDFETASINPPPAAQETLVTLSAGDSINAAITYAQPSELTFFQTGPSFTIQVTLFGETNAFPGAGTIDVGTISRSFSAGGELELTYFYEPAAAEVPEPATLTLAGSGVLAGLTGLGVRRRRRGPMLAGGSRR
jgi:hypothetical protein